MSKTTPSVISDTEAASSWGAILIGAFSAAAVSVALATLGIGTGLSLTSPWSGQGVSVTTLKWTAGAYLVLTAIIASTIGGYMAGRLRSKWPEASRQEVLFRDTAHGMAAWAFATLLVVAVAGSGATALLSSAIGSATHGAAHGATSSQNSSGTDYYADMLFRPSASVANSSSDATNARQDVRSIFARSLVSGSTFSDSDRTYLAQIVAQHAGISQPEADKRVTDTIMQAKTYVDATREYTAAFALWSTLALLAGAFAAAAGAIEGGQLRDGRWRGVIFVPRNSMTAR